MTDDGTEGEKGFVTSAAERLLSDSKFDMVYTCGPKPMLKGMAKIVDTYKTKCEVSLENYFGCGTGICYGCTIRTKIGNKRVCTEGPVFDIEVIDFDLI